jgi:hypothetical protein
MRQRGNFLTQSLERRKRDERDVEWATYDAPADARGSHFVLSPCNAQRILVGGPAHSFAPGASVPVASESQGADRVIIREAPPGRRGASAFAVDFSGGQGLGDPVCPLPLTGHEYLVLFVDGSTIRTSVYLDGDWARDLFTATMPAGYVFPNGYDSAVVLSGTRLAWLGEHDSSNDAAVIIFDGAEGGSGAISAHRATGVPWADSTREVIEVGGQWVFVRGYYPAVGDDELRVYTTALGGGTPTLSHTFAFARDRYSFEDLIHYGASFELLGWDFDNPGPTDPDTSQPISTFLEIFYPDAESIENGTLLRRALYPDTHGSSLAARPLAGAAYRYTIAYGAGATERGSLTRWTQGDGEEALWPQAWGLTTNAATVSPSPLSGHLAVYPVWQAGAVSGNGNLLRATTDDRSGESFDADNCEPPWIAVSDHPTTGLTPVAMLCMD